MTQNNNITNGSSIDWCDLVQDISAPFYKREKETSAILVAMLSDLNCVLIGKAGTGKTALASRILEVFPSPTFQCQLHPYSEPEDILGSLSLKALREEDRRTRMTSGYLPCSRYALLDECFKARSTTLSALLSLLNERQYIEEGVAIPSALKSVIGASNEYPDEESGALSDRFALWIPFDYIEDRAGLIDHILDSNGFPELIEKDKDGGETRILDTRKLRAFRQRVDEIIQTNKALIKKYILAFDEKLTEKLKSRAGSMMDGRLSDRSFIQCIRLVATACALRGDSQVRVEDTWIFEFLSRDYAYAPIYKQVVEETTKAKDSLATLKDRLKKNSRSDIAIVKGLFKSLPFYWQVELTEMLRSIDTAEDKENNTPKKDSTLPKL